MSYEIARYITDILDDMQIVTNEHDLNCVLDALMNDVILGLMLEDEYR